MRPLALELTAFGPYPELVRLDFSLLPDGTLFLVHGPTGSGKTTILDALCFALYGDSSGSERQGGDLRSQLAAADTLTELLFDFRLGSERFRVHRVPEQPRPKKRGGGFTVQAKEATLSAVGDDGAESRVLATGWSRVNEAIEGRLGLDAGQFRQVVLLPQGQFRRLLLADSREREAILETLFDTRRFRRLEEALKSRATELKREAETLTTRREECALSADRLLRGEDRGAEAPTRELLSVAEAAVSTQLEAESAAAELAAGAARDMAEALRRGEAARKALDELEAARRRRAELEARREQVAQWTAELDLARRAAGLSPAVARQARAEKALADAREALEKAVAAEDLAAKSARVAQRAREVETGLDAEAERKRAAAELSHLEALREPARELGKQRLEHDERERAEEAARAALAAREAALAELKTKREAAERRRAEALSSSDPKGELRTALDAARVREAAARELAELLETERVAREAARAAVGAAEAGERGLEEASSHREAVEKAHAAGEAARLAGSLREGLPCPVCGSTDHPSPARSEDELPTEEQRQAAADRLEAARGRRDRLNAEKHRLEARAEAAAGAVRKRVERASLENAGRLEATAGLDESASLEDAGRLEELVEAHRRARRACEEAERAREQAEAESKVLAALEAERERETLASSKALDRLGNARSEAAVARSRLEACLARIPERLREPGALEAASSEAAERVRELEIRLDSARKVAAAADERLAGARAERAAAEARVAERAGESNEAAAELATALEAEGIGSVEAWEAARRSPERCDELARGLSAFERDWAASGEQLASCERAATGAEEPDLPALRHASEQAEAERSKLADRRARTRQRLDSARASLAELSRLDGERAALEARYGSVGRVAALATGTNSRNLSLHRFVLGALLDQVLDVASLRLARMSRGRYRLRRAGDLRDGRRAAGLDLEVEDEYSGQARPVATLSGGESFLAALALALSLAQVVQEHAGGLRLDALFIDEGFGSLDPDALDLALSTLEKLGSDGGRLVGVISHVTELVHRIPTQLKVHADPRGSTAEFVLP